MRRRAIVMIVSLVLVLSGVLFGVFYSHAEEAIVEGAAGTSSVVIKGPSNNKDKNNTSKHGKSDTDWLSGVSKGGIYGKGKGVEIGEGSEDEEPGIVEGFFVSIFSSLGKGFHGKMKDIGSDINSVIMGRLNGGGVSINGKRVALFTFELKDSNPFGIVASSIYNILRGVSYIVIMCIVMSFIAMAAYKSGSGDSMKALKDSVTNAIISIAMLSLMPNMVNIILYVRDVILYTIGVGLNETLFGKVASIDLVKAYAENADKSLINSMMFFGAAVLGVWFAFSYVGLAMSYIVDFIAFPFICGEMFFDKKALGQWWKQVIGNALVPVADMSLLLVPLAIGELGGNAAPVTFIQLMACTMVIPSRGLLRMKLGIGSSNSMELAGIGTLLGAMSLGKAAVKTAVSSARSIGGGISEYKKSRDMADFYEDLGNESGAGVGGVDSDYSNFDNAAYATVNNLDNPDIASHLSNSKKAELYREKAKRDLTKGIGGGVGRLAGGTIGGGVGFGAATFLSPAAKGYMAGIGMEAGGALGDAAGGAVAGAGLKFASGIENMAADAYRGAFMSGGSSEGVPTGESDVSFQNLFQGLSPSEEGFVEPSMENEANFEGAGIGIEDTGGYAHMDAEFGARMQNVARSVTFATTSEIFSGECEQFNNYVDECRGMEFSSTQERNEVFRNGASRKYAEMAYENFSKQEVYKAFESRASEEQLGKLKDNYINIVSRAAAKGGVFSDDKIEKFFD